MKTLFVAGTWDLNNGKESGLIKKIYLELKKYEKLNIDYYNGGNYNELNNLLNSVINYEIVFWMVNVPNNLEKIRNVKEINPKTMLITSKRNNNEYSFQELIQKALSSKSNLVIEFTRVNDIYQMKLFDPLGNVWYIGTDIEAFVKSLVDRLLFIKKITRQSTIKDEENTGALAWFFNMFKQEMYEDKTKFKDLEIKEKEEFLELVKEYASIFAGATMETKDVKRFLGNASFRCLKGFPSFRNNKYILVTKRNVNKEHITIDDFVPVYLEDDKLYYQGEFKPSVDTPIQVRLYKKLPNINYMIHSHCYIKNAPTTLNSLPCGAIEEVEEILDLIEKEYGDFSKNFYVLNLKGHGSIMMSNDVEKLKNVEIIGRKLPEIM